MNPFPFVCPDHKTPLERDSEGGIDFVCESGCSFPVVDGIPRFVSEENYAGAFGLQWKKFSKTQLDSYTQTTYSARRLSRIIDDDLELFRGKRVLEVGCGAGRFTELMLGHGAEVLAVDLSQAVEANYENCSRFDSYAVCQADVRRLPVRKGEFDVVFCVGVIQHTPDPEETIHLLFECLANGGLLVIDHYSDEYPHNLMQRALRASLTSMTPERSFNWCKRIVALAWPLHRVMAPMSRMKLVWRLHEAFLKHISPVVDHQFNYTELSPQLIYEWSLLDTHDTLTDTYKHIRTKEQIENCLANLGLEVLRCQAGGNGVEAIAKKN